VACVGELILLREIEFSIVSYLFIAVYTFYSGLAMYRAANEWWPVECNRETLC